ncbi:MAG: CRISPR-associated protein Cas5 [Pirellulales bacterium]
MITLRVDVPFASFRKSFARSFAETYPLPPPATIYGMLLSLVGERFRARHEGVRLAFAFKRLPHIATTLRKLSRFKYGVPSKQSKLGNAPDFIETLCGLEFLCWVDSTNEMPNKGPTARHDSRLLESRIIEAINTPNRVQRYGVLCLGLSDDAVNEIELCEILEGTWLRLVPRDTGDLELPIWVDHVGSFTTRWQRYHLDTQPTEVHIQPPVEQFTTIAAPI